ncbi:type II toxin-antitoxin system VapC family toxin [Georgenia sp. Z1491]|uniref:type II toxin-antitoxin system VapC family toxin n=1 Tax=Georgenia sp. Z1491 TaxID=3416707 RepID=UPI003CE91114
MTADQPRRALLDTSVLIDFPAAQVAEAADEVAVSAVSIAELQYGVTAAADPVAQMYRRRRVQTILEHFEVLAFDTASAEYYGALAALVRHHGRNPRPRRMDLQIAATAARHGLRLLTRNGADFRGLESALTVIDLGVPAG